VVEIWDVVMAGQQKRFVCVGKIHIGTFRDSTLSFDSNVRLHEINFTVQIDFSNPLFELMFLFFT